MNQDTADEKIIVARTFETAALLRVLGFAYSDALNGRRISLVFKDPDGKGEETLRRHEAEGIEVNSLAFVDALNWAKRIIFSYKDTHRERS